MSRNERVAKNLDEWLRDPTLTPGWTLSEGEKKAQEAGRLALGTAIRATEAPVVEDLRKVGFDVESVWDLFNRNEPWRTDMPIPSYHEAVRTLIRHLGHSTPFYVQEGVVRALTAPWGSVAFDRIVEQFQRGVHPTVAAEEKARGADLVLAHVRDAYPPGELERIMDARWESFRFAIANAIGEHFQQEHIPLILALIQDTAYGPGQRRALAKALREKMRRWRRKDEAILGVVNSVLQSSPT